MITDISFTVATKTWLTVMEYLCHKWPRICSTCRNHKIRSFHRSWLSPRFCNKSDTMGATSGAGTAYFSGTFEFNPGLMWGSCCSSFSFLCGVALCFMQIVHAYSANSSCIFSKFMHIQDNNTFNNIYNGDGNTGWTTFYFHWKSMERLTIYLVCSSIFAKSAKEACNVPATYQPLNTIPTVVHGQIFRIII